VFVNFFISRPIFSAVCSIILALAGLLAIPSLPIAQYPDLAPPQVTVTSTYVGASSDVVESAVTIPLEQELNGVEGMRFISSTSGNDGVSTITITFQPTRDIDVAAVDVQNRVSRASARLPAQVNQAGTPYDCLLQNDVNLTSPPLDATCTDATTATTFSSHFPNAPFTIPTVTGTKAKPAWIGL